MPLGWHKNEFLGYLVREGTITIPQHRVEALASFGPPTTKKGLRLLFGSIGFYRRYIELLARQTAILTPIMAKLIPSKIVWMEESELAFKSICTYISECSTLCIPLREDVFSLVTDSSRCSNWRSFAGVERGQLGSSCLLQLANVMSRTAVFGS